MKRSPLKRKTGLKRKRKKKSKLAKNKENVRSKYWRTKADAEWSKYVKGAGKCIIDNEDCSPQLHPHHLISRSVKHLRHDLMNGVCLCAVHHTFSGTLSAHKAPFAFYCWLKEHRPEIIWWTEQHMWSEGSVDYKAAYERLVERNAQNREEGRDGREAD